jgi:hypothetical protein
MGGTFGRVERAVEIPSGPLPIQPMPKFTYRGFANSEKSKDRSEALQQSVSGVVVVITFGTLTLVVPGSSVGGDRV